MRGLLRHRDARVYLAGQCLSSAGDNALWLAMGIYVKILTGSSSAAGLVFFAYCCGSLLAPASGVIADRFRRRPVLLAANLGAGAGVCALLAAGPGRVWLIYVVMAGYGAAGTVITSAQAGLLTVIVPADLLGEANSVLQAASVGLRIITPLIGAGLLAVAGPRPVIALDAVTFAGAALAVARLRCREPAPAPAAAGLAARRAELTAGIRHVGRVPELRRLLTAGVVALLAFGFFETVPFAVVGQGLHRSPAFLGVLETAMGAGALAGALAAAPLMRRAGERGLAAAGLAGGTASCAALLSRSLPAVLAAMAAMGAFIVWVNVGAFTLLQRRTPPELLGRTAAALDVAVLIPQTLSIALGAGLLAVLGYRVLLMAMGAGLLASAGYLARPLPPAPAPQTAPG
jgi:MFS family permease